MIAERIKSKLESQELSIEDFAKKIGQSTEIVNSWLDGSNSLPADSLEKIRKVLRVSYDYLLSEPKNYSGIEESPIKFEEFKNWIDEKFVGTHIFRGQRNDWPLMTSFCRACKNKNSLDIFSEIPKFDMKTFCNFCPIPKFMKTLESRVKLECSVLDSEGVLRNLMPIPFLAYMQHYGVPTPLLDWSYSPFIAAFFAIKDASPEDNIVIYDLDLTSYQKDYPLESRTLEKPETVFFQIVNIPRENLRHLNQQGLFTLCQQIPNVESYFQSLYEKTGKKYLKKRRFTLDKFQKSRTMESFKRMNITERSLFPAPAYIAKDIIDELFSEHYETLSNDLLKALDKPTKGALA